MGAEGIRGLLWPAGGSGGLAYWANRLDLEGGSLRDHGEFGYSDEFNRRYGGLTHAALVTSIYRQLLGRDPEQLGLDYYVGELQSRRRTLQSIRWTCLVAATGMDALTVANRLDVANHSRGRWRRGAGMRADDGREQPGGSHVRPLERLGGQGGDRSPVRAVA